MSSWKEVLTAKAENRHEIKLSGAEISKRIQDNGFDHSLFEVSSLNLLTISDTVLKTIPNDICKLVNLQSLLLYGNKIDEFNDYLSSLSKLKVLDLSGNQIKKIPDSINSLKELTHINFGSNALESFPALKDLPNLISLNLSNNKLANFPEIENSNLPHLSDLNIKCNLIEFIPECIAKKLPALKNFDISDNLIKEVPGEVAQLAKLKDINLKGNKLADKRLMKLVDQCRTKQILDYVNQHSVKSSNHGGKKGKKQKQEESTTQEPEEINKSCHSVTILHLDDDTMKVKLIDGPLSNLRPYIVCCIVKDVRFSDDSFKRFIQLQTKLHDSICDKRNSATIATHDLDKIAPGDITYTAKSPAKLKIIPLMRHKEYSGEELFHQIQAEAETLRKEKKRNVYSGIHKYLYLLEGKDLYPCIQGSDGKVISFPPITNSDGTKITLQTKNVLVEVTSQVSHNVCKRILDKVLEEFVLLGIGSKEGENYNSLTVQQVKVVDLEGNLKSVYPSRTDCNFEADSNIKVIRPKK